MDIGVMAGNRRQNSKIKAIFKNSVSRFFVQILIDI
jgi:hypothetical protein